MSKIHNDDEEGGGGGGFGGNVIIGSKYLPNVKKFARCQKFWRLSKILPNDDEEEDGILGKGSPSVIDWARGA